MGSTPGGCRPSWRRSEPCSRSSSSHCSFRWSSRKGLRARPARAARDRLSASSWEACASVRETASITGVLQLHDRPDLDRSDPRRWEPRGEGAGLVHVPGLDDEESAQLLLCLGKGADAGGDLVGPDADGPGRPPPLQSVRDDVVSALSDLLGVLDRGVDKRLHLLLGHRVQHALVVVDREHELHRILLTAEALSFSTRYERMASDTSLSFREVRKSTAAVASEDYAARRARSSAAVRR